MKKVLIAESDVNPQNYDNYLSKATNLSIAKLPSMAESKKEAIQVIEENIEKIYESNAVVFTGGRDLDPKFYGDDLSADKMERFKVKVPSNNRDQIENAYLRFALKEKKAIVGICRGMQFINQAFDGEMYYDLMEEGVVQETHLEHNDGVSRTHEITPMLSSPWLADKLFTDGRRERVNSRHHQAVKKVGRDLVVTARSHDGVIEMIESEDLKKRIVLVQFHPEMMIEEPDNPEFAQRLLDVVSNL